MSVALWCAYCQIHDWHSNNGSRRALWMTKQPARKLKYVHTVYTAILVTWLLCIFFSVRSFFFFLLFIAFTRVSIFTRVTCCYTISLFYNSFLFFFLSYCEVSSCRQIVILIIRWHYNHPWLLVYCVLSSSYSISCCVKLNTLHTMQLATELIWLNIKDIRASTEAVMRSMLCAYSNSF